MKVQNMLSDQTSIKKQLKIIPNSIRQTLFTLSLITHIVIN